MCWPAPSETASRHPAVKSGIREGRRGFRGTSPDGRGIITAQNLHAFDRLFQGGIARRLLPHGLKTRFGVGDRAGIENRDQLDRLDYSWEEGRVGATVGCLIQGSDQGWQIPGGFHGPCIPGACGIIGEALQHQQRRQNREPEARYISHEVPADDYATRSPRSGWGTRATCGGSKRVNYISNKGFYVDIFGSGTIKM
jgi:hypothetical protein